MSPLVRAPLGIRSGDRLCFRTQTSPHGCQGVCWAIGPDRLPERGQTSQARSSARCPHCGPRCKPGSLWDPSVLDSRPAASPGTPTIPLRLVVIRPARRTQEGVIPRLQSCYGGYGSGPGKGRVWRACPGGSQQEASVSSGSALPDTVRPELRALGVRLREESHHTGLMGHGGDWQGM